jgi:FlaA1/EpsC-like NDP-sugar epimerase
MRSLILGGTGTLGTALTERLLLDHDNEVICFSRDELKQQQMRARFNSHRLRFILGDIRDASSLARAMPLADVVFSVAALKHIESGENNPEECVKTNILGTINVADEAVKADVPYVVFSSTDKAVDPLNTYGMCKGISEKILLNRNDNQRCTRFSVFRYGNVLGSRGSVIDSFVRSLLMERAVYVTDTAMTRFWIRIEDAVDCIVNNYSTAPMNEPFIPQIKAAPLMLVIEVIADILGIDKYDIQSIGLRQSEKLHELLISQHDTRHFASNTADQLSHFELTEMLLPIVTEAAKLR